ncbi:phosphatidylinositol-specific phospholipase C1-like protein [Spongiimicrobium sp. 3-5]|uniref:phosphatidylinositol-specific phospholipase C1-like protein n=1 Tax=Spongiimicrobium sp. 3-5 TaxID=3332596 RepID=UPI00397F5D99
MIKLKVNIIKMGYLWVMACSVLMVLGACKKEKINLNQVQVIGSHNSYKIAIEEPLLDYLYEIDSSKALALQYDHPTIAKQLDLGLRNLELDVFYDPEGGYYSDPHGLELVKQRGAEAAPFDLHGDLKKPGLKMFHIQEIDFRSHNLLFKEGLKEIKDWSDRHKDHWPIFILINAKDSKIPNTRDPFKFDNEALNKIDEEIREVFKGDRLITPDAVRGHYSTLEEAVLHNNWPLLKKVTGKVLFVLDENEEKIGRYLKTYPNLENAALFVNRKEGNPEAGFRIINDPVKDHDYIKELVSRGYMVRTRADAGTKEARGNDYQRFEKAKSSGAQVISTDYYIPTRLFPSKFQVVLEGGGYQKLNENQK